jgi:hypothetical protein
MKVGFKGGKELDAALRELEKGAARRTAERALKSAAEPIRDDWVGGVDVQSSDMKRSIKIGKRAQTRATRRFRRGAGQDVVTQYIGIDASVNPRLAAGGGDAGTKRWTGYAFIEEFGDAGQPANPAGRRAWESQKMTAFNRLADDLRAEIMKTAERAARKAAKKAGG